MKFENIIIVNDFAYVQGGADMVAIYSAIGLSKMGKHVVFFAGCGPISSELFDAGVKVVNVNKKDILHDNNRLRAVTKGIFDNNVKKIFDELLSQYNPNNTIIHVHTWTKALTSAVFSVAARKNFHIVLTLHDFFSVCPNGGFYNYKQQCICKLKPMSIKCIGTNCDLRNYCQKLWRIIRQLMQNSNIRKVRKLHLLAISKKVAEVVVPLFSYNDVSISYLHNPVEILNNEQVDILNNQKYLFMGRLAEEKGPRLFCQAISQLGLKGVVIGDGYLKDSLEKEFPNIEFTGWLTGLQKYNKIKECKCFVFTSRWYETFGLVVAEMQALGVPSIVPEESAAAEQIENHKNGLLYTSGDIVSLKDAIEKFEHMDIREIQKHVLSSFKADLFSLKTHVENLLSIYEKFMCD